ncbi:Glycerophosphoryl diester phosphodiesterase [Sulfitobacter noctilucicola]|uniref:Glycerophosphoryl diester phosphodiesterase n=1 Tax=Sulfitobacter noctilucicola TaxID=1342301 RepID=A0A7W6M6E4_9RHOB|nr:glycerophosphodiester phosphodiesterase family protein [Sulfitobacter noctilucicola]KIN62517.1 Glycerophosphoryl diester phosphodiesterase [Sulfitobacter noctilucicola]MBB4172953.1 glycerophosphoryl diester phosphodiesterase [Sulfitobacter noctilucicola]
MTLSRLFYDVPLAHRALHNVSDGRPENSRAAIRAAIAAGYGIEIDVQLSADGAAMVFHDYALERLTGEKGAIRLRPASELGKIKLLGGDEGIPDLEEVLDLVAGQVPLVIEVKDQDGGMGQDIGPLEDAVVAGVKGYAGPLALMSFNPNVVARLAETLPDVPRGIVTSAYRYEDWPLPRATCDQLRQIPDFERVGASFVSHEVDDLSTPRVAEIKDQGAMIFCWTVRSAEQASEARKIADNITFEGFLPALTA